MFRGKRRMHHRRAVPHCQFWVLKFMNWKTSDSLPLIRILVLADLQAHLSLTWSHLVWRTALVQMTETS
jgi:hypothetical protein